MMHAGAAGATPAFSKRATAVSIALHGAAVWLVVAFASKHPSPPRPAAVTLTAVEVMSQGPAASALPATLPPAHKAVAVRPSARAAAEPRGRPTPVARTEPVEPKTMQSLADLQVHYEDTTRFADHERAPLADVTSGIGLTGIGEAPGVAIPDTPAGPSRARGPKPKHDYTNLRITGASRFAGKTISLRLSIDVHGRVQAVQVLKGVDYYIDRRTVTMVRDFEYAPALGDDGTPVAGTQRWDFQVIEDDEL